MKKKVFIAAIALSSLVSCNSKGFNYKTLELKEANASTKHEYETYKTEGYELFKSGLIEFENDVVSKFYSYNENKDFLFSPTTLFNCMSLLTPLVKDDIKSDVLNALHIDETTLLENYALYFDRLIRSNEKYMQNVTNSIWIKDGLTYKQNSIDTLADNFRTSSFAFEDVGTLLKALDSYIREKTNNLLNADNIKLDASTLMVLLSTLYIKDIWNDEGRNLGYYEKSIDFKNNNGTITNTAMLSGNNNRGKVYKTDTFSKFYTSFYNGTKLSFIVPNENKSISDVLNENNIDEILHFKNYVTTNDELKEKYYTSTVFPEFETNSKYELNEFLANDLNLSVLFNSENTDTFSNFSDDTSLYVSNVIQENKLIVNKKGIEGASYTANVLVGSAAGSDYKKVYYTFIIDKEFIYVLQDINDNILFVGTISSL